MKLNTKTMHTIENLEHYDIIGNFVTKRKIKIYKNTFID